ncbi:hypothetical protein J4E85_008746 [Alternaria conjuncta]|uniref:uncharacterized protein n=1 Tax=Alternaria conjuncta TaxID=181017 RepID=UPI00221E7AA5|nr:uncharacterized protein J4E85_008746 [Alternaria conjuncta]KAI4921401.1 hypothetical protein J4E85_008746 [Alternaria conjuncta]
MGLKIDAPLSLEIVSPEQLRNWRVPGHKGSDPIRLLLLDADQYGRSIGLFVRRLEANFYARVAPNIFEHSKMSKLKLETLYFEDPPRIPRKLMSCAMYCFHFEFDQSEYSISSARPQGLWDQDRQELSIEIAPGRNDFPPYNTFYGMVWMTCHKPGFTLPFSIFIAYHVVTGRLWTQLLSSDYTLREIEWHTAISDMEISRRYRFDMSILLPLYVYPSAGAWEPLYTAAKAHKNVDFNVIINPCSGPCMGSLPDQVYLDEVPKLRAYPNIRTLGYVATDYADKPIESLLAEIDTYARWPKVTNISKMRVDGIFLDETPSTFDEDDYEYLKTANQAIKNNTAFSDRFIAHNPGLIPTSILTSPTVLQESYLNLTDLTVVFEETFDKWLDRDIMVPLQAHKIRRSKLAVILHSLPNLTGEVLEFMVQQVENTADWVFLTDSADDYYHTFSAMFGDLVKAVDGSS